MESENILPLGFAFIPDCKDRHAVFYLHQRIQEKYPSEYILQENGTSLLPHISLFQGRFLEEKLPILIKLFERKGIQRPRALSVPVFGVEVWATKIFFLDLVITPLLCIWERELRTCFNPLRERAYGPADPQQFMGISTAEQYSWDKYGIPFVGDAFRPHFTLGRSEHLDGDEVLFAQMLEKEFPLPGEITFTHLVLFDVGTFGSVENIRHSIRLGKE